MVSESPKSCSFMGFFKELFKLALGILALVTEFSVVLLLAVCGGGVYAPTAQMQIACAKAVFFLFCFLIYCYWREKLYACMDQWATWWSNTFFSAPETKPYVVKLLVSMRRYMLFFVAALFLTCSLELLSFGPDCFKEVEKLNLAQQFSDKCFWNGHLLTLFAIMTLISFFCGGFDGIEKQASQKSFIKWLFNRVYGHGLFENYWNICTFGTLFALAAIHAALAGWITKESVSSLTFISALLTITLPCYMIHFLLCAVLELMVYCMHRSRNQDKHELPFRKPAPVSTKTSSVDAALHRFLIGSYPNN